MHVSTTIILLIDEGLNDLSSFALAWILMSLTAPLWMASIVERPYTITVPPPAQTGLIVTPSSECVNLDDCGTFAISFNVTLSMSFFLCSYRLSYWY